MADKPASDPDQLILSGTETYFFGMFKPGLPVRIWMGKVKFILSPVMIRRIYVADSAVGK